MYVQRLNVPRIEQISFSQLYISICLCPHPPLPCLLRERRNTCESVGRQEKANRARSRSKVEELPDTYTYISLIEKSRAGTDNPIIPARSSSNYGFQINFILINHLQFQPSTPSNSQLSRLTISFNSTGSSLFQLDLSSAISSIVSRRTDWILSGI